MKFPRRLSFAWLPFRLLVLVLLAAVQEPGRAVPIVDGITFAGNPGRVHVPLDEAARHLGWTLAAGSSKSVVCLGGRPVPVDSLRRLTDGSLLVSIQQLAAAGAGVDPGKDGELMVAGRGLRRMQVRVGAKRAEINLAEQRLRAWQGDRLVMETRVSSGRGGSTPAGDFTAGPYKARMHYSTRYQNAPMPWSVQVTGHVFIHGFTSVPDYPASHGCIRVPLDHGNPARFFYEWVDRGTPIRILRK